MPYVNGDTYSPHKSVVRCLPLPTKSATILRRHITPSARLTLTTAAVAAYAARVGGSTRFTIALSHEDLHPLVQEFGDVVNACVPVQVDVDLTKSFAEHSTQVASEVLESRQKVGYWRDLPLRSPKLAQSDMIHEPVLGIREFQSPIAPPDRPNALIEFSISSSDGSLYLTYDADAVSEESADHIAEQFTSLFSAALTMPATPIGKLPLLDESTQQKILHEFNMTKVDYGKPRCVHQYFEEQARRSPHSLAVKIANRSLSYKRLNCLASYVALKLRELGVGPDSLVGVSMTRSLEMVVALLGILKAGGAYVPLDPDLPPERLSFMERDAGLSILLTQEKLITTMKGIAKSTVAIDTQIAEAHAFEGDYSNPQVTPEDLLYMIYTSGSTGNPKGVLVPHKGIVNWLLWMQHEFDVSHHDRVLQKASLSFDVSAWECFLPLITGGTLILAEPGKEADTGYMADLLVESHVSLAQFVPSLLSPLLEESRLKECSSLRHVMCGGEPLPPSLIKRFHQKLNAKLCNSYGPTEASIGVTKWNCCRSASPVEVPIGRPIANIKIYVLDEWYQPVPIGATGEIFISGGLARGYHNQSTLSSERFVHNPYGSGTYSLMYKTGDIGKLLQDGNIVFLGRLDRQIKIRGLRIELGEIESVLATHPDIRDAVVQAIDGRQDTQALAAYVVPKQGRVLNESNIRDLMIRQLPQYMVPAYFLCLENLPLNPNGKVDYAALPVPTLDRSSQRRTSPLIPPESDLQQTLVELWASILGLDEISIDDSFFDLGGHSLLAARLVAKVAQMTGAKLQLRDVFDAPTVALMASMIQNRLDNLIERNVPSIYRASRRDWLPVTISQERSLSSWKGSLSTYSNVPLHFALHIRGSLDLSALKEAVQSIVRRHEALRTEFRILGDKWVQRPHHSTMISIDQIEFPSGCVLDESMDRFLAKELAKPFDLTGAPLIRVSVSKLNDREQILLIVIPHLVFDGWSKSILYQELSAFYAYHKSERRPTLPSVRMQFSDYGAWQRDQLAKGELDWQLDYWLRKLDQIPFPILEIPTDKPRTPNTSHDGALVSKDIPSKLSAGIRSLSRSQGSTTFMLMSAALMAFLVGKTGRSDIVVRSQVALRFDPTVESTIGMLVNIVNIRSNLSPDLSFRKVLRRVSSTLLEAYQNQDYPHSLVISRLFPDNPDQMTTRISLLPQDATGGDGAYVLPEVIEGAHVEEVSTTTLGPDTRGYDLSFGLTLGTNPMKAHCFYSTDLFEEDTVRALLHEYVDLTEACVKQPDLSVLQLIQKL